MTRAAYMTAAATAITESTGIRITAEQAEMVLGTVWDIAQREASDAAQFSRIMKNACGQFACDLRSLKNAA